VHIDGSWGAPAIFSPTHKYKMNGSHLADSIAINPHKMMGVPLTCSFLLSSDLRQFHKANTLPAGYLFHSSDSDSDLSTPEEEKDEEVWDLADLTLQCGRRGDSLKLALAWIYYGTSGFSNQIDDAFSIASYFASEVAKRENFVLVSENPPPCLQVCFYWAKGGKLSDDVNDVTKGTSRMVERLIKRGFMVDYSPGERGSFFRAVVNRETRMGTVDGLIRAIEEIGESLN